jgi:biotin synthase
MTAVEQILEKTEIGLSDITALIAADEEDCAALFRKALTVKRNFAGNRVYLRGLIEYSNYCTKNCFYCGIRSANSRNARYEMTEDEVLEAARYAWQHRFGSIVLQSGERDDEAFVSRIEQLIGRIQEMARHELHITLSLGEQRRETYRRWFQAGAHRYLLRVEDANSELYRKLHPSDARHAYEGRVQALRDLRSIGYQVGTGVMIGLPFQTIRDLADDLIFFRDLDVDMVGMGPYIEHKDTPLYEYRGDLLPLPERLRLSLKMVAVLRILMKDINIAATTALQAIDPMGRELALQAGANVIMPNLTPTRYRQDYLLYENKPCLDEETAESMKGLENRIRMAGDTLAFGEWGDSKHFEKRNSED